MAVDGGGGGGGGGREGEWVEKGEIGQRVEYWGEMGKGKDKM